MVSGWKLLIIIKKRSILDVAAVLDPPLQLPQKCLDLLYHHYETSPSSDIALAASKLSL